MLINSQFCPFLHVLWGVQSMNSLRSSRLQGSLIIFYCAFFLLNYKWMKRNNEKKVHNILQRVSWLYNLKELSERNKQRIVEAKKECEQLVGEHHHKEQCDGIPQSFAKNDCLHLEPCCKKFTLILTGQSTRQSNNRRSSSRKSVGEVPG